MGARSSIGGSSKKGRQHVAHERKYVKQKDRTAKNKERAWKRHLKNHPNDMRAKEDIKRVRGTM